MRFICVNIIIMKKNTYTSLALVLCFAFSMAMPAFSGEVLTWEDCVKAALANNPSLKAKRKALEQSEYTFKEAFNSSYLPKFSLSGLSYRISGNNHFTGGGRGEVGGLSVSASETLWSASVNSSYRTSKLTYEQARISYESESASLRRTLYSKFMTLLVEQEQVKVNQKVLAIRKENANITKLKYDSGRESLGNMKFAKAQYNQALVSKHKSDRSLENARRELLAAMGEDEYRNITVKATLRNPDRTFTEEQLKTALETSPSMRSQRITLQKAEESVKSAKSAMYPALTASQSIGWGGQRPVWGETKNWSVGVSLSLPFVSGWFTHHYNNIKAAKSGLSAAEENYREAKINLETNLRSAHASLMNACETVEAGQMVLEANEERYKEAQINYMAGNMSFINFETVEQSLVDAQQNQLQYLKTANEQRINLESLLGVTLEK